MGLKDRVNRLEKQLREKNGCEVYVCSQDEETDSFIIPRLDFKGTIPKGKRFMEDMERQSSQEILFVIFNGPRPEQVQCTNS